MRIREKDAKKRQQAGGQEGTYRRKPTPVKRYAGDLLAPVSVTQHGVCCSDFYSLIAQVIITSKTRISESGAFFVDDYKADKTFLFFTNLSLCSFTQSYLQSLRDRQMGTGTSLSSLGTTNQTMIDLDYDTGSTVPLTATTPVVRV